MVNTKYELLLNTPVIITIIIKQWDVPELTTRLSLYHRVEIIWNKWYLGRKITQDRRNKREIAKTISQTNKSVKTVSWIPVKWVLVLRSYFLVHPTIYVERDIIWIWNLDHLNWRGKKTFEICAAEGWWNFHGFKKYRWGSSSEEHKKSNFSRQIQCRKWLDILRYFS